MHLHYESCPGHRAGVGRFANYLLPLMIGARDVALSRALTLVTWMSHVRAACAVCVGFFRLPSPAVSPTCRCR